MKYSPKPHQKQIITAIKNNLRLNVWSGMGTGKTSATATALHELGAYPILIVAPKRVALSTWPDEYAKWDHLKGVNVVAISGTPKKRLQQLALGADVYTINYELLGWLYEQDINFKTIVADESTRLKSFRTRRKKTKGKFTVKPSWCLAKLTCKAKRHINLTGTPTPNGLTDLWGQHWFVDQGESLGKSFSAFEQRWFRVITLGNAYAKKLEPFDHSFDEITKVISDKTISIEGLDVDEPVHNVVEVELPKKAMDQYKQMEKEWFLEIDSNEAEAFNPAGKMGKCLQIASGFVYGENGPIDLHDAKIEALKSIVNEACGMPVLVSYWWKLDPVKIMKAFPGARMLDSNPQTIEDWNAGKIPMLLAHPASCGHGLNLQYGGNILVFYSDSWGLEPYLQIIERIGPMRQKQAGFDRPVYIHHITAKDTLDSSVMESHRAKKSLQDAVLESRTAVIA